MNKITVCDKEYNINSNISNALEALIEIKKTSNKSLAFKYGCKSGVCGSCSVLINGVEQLACACKINDADNISPLKNLDLIKGLVVDDSNIKEKLLQVDANLNDLSSNIISQKSVDVIDVQSNCILCNSCYSSCPVYEVNKDFIGPFALTRAFRYIKDDKEASSKSKLDAMQTNGVWDCTLCGNCSAVCPQAIDIKNDIVMLQNISVQNGYENPAFSSNNSFDSFGDDDFGFNPNSF